MTYKGYFNLAARYKFRGFSPGTQLKSLMDEKKLSTVTKFGFGL